MVLPAGVMDSGFRRNDGKLQSGTLPPSTECVCDCAAAIADLKAQLAALRITTASAYHGAMVVGAVTAVSDRIATREQAARARPSNGNRAERRRYQREQPKGQLF